MTTRSALKENTSASLNKGSISSTLLHTPQQKQVFDSTSKKCYYVAKGGRPAEVYCTDLVHKARLGPSKRNQNCDESRLIKVLDRWREEWNHGVQMPLCTTRQTYQFEECCLLAELRDYEPFQLPNKYVLRNPNKRYIKEYSSRFEECKRDELFYYEMDIVDEKFLSENFSDTAEFSISPKIFVTVMNILEMDCYKNIHLKLLEELIIWQKKKDEDADCDICCRPEWEPGDEIVFCDGCNTCVHQICYGLETLPTNEWFCSSCSFNNSENIPQCIFCPIQGGALKFTRSFESWAHVICALWIPEVRFVDPDRREPISHVSEVPVDRWKAKCVLCDTNAGACIQCTHSNCETTFHVSCAQKAGFSLNIEHSFDEKNGVSMNSFCAKHFPKNILDHNITGSPRRNQSSKFLDQNHLLNMMQNFIQFVDCKEIAKHLNISKIVVAIIFNYWKWKRIQNNYNSLLNASVDIKPYLPVKRVKKLKTSPMKTPKKNKKKTKSSFKKACDLIPPEQLTMEYEKFRELRLNLEKARNLSYMVKKREKLKRAAIDLLEEGVTTIPAVLLEGIVPVSRRKANRLLEIWDQNISLVNNYESPQPSTSTSCYSAQKTESKDQILLSNPSKNLTTDIYTFRSFPPAPVQKSNNLEEDESDNASTISTLTEYSLAGSNDNASIFDYENSVIVEVSPKRKKIKLQRPISRYSISNKSPPTTNYTFNNAIKARKSNFATMANTVDFPKRKCLRNYAL